MCDSDTISFASTADCLVGAGMLAELLLNELDAEGLGEKVDSLEHSLELRKCQYMKAVGSEFRLNKRSELSPQ